MDHSKLILQVCLIAALFSWEWFLPFYKFKGDKLSHGARNLTLAVINGIIGTFIFSALVVYVMEFSQTKGVGILNWLGVTTGRAALAFLLFDAWMYFWHRLNHRVPFLWRFHRVHHSDTEMDVTTGLRFHPGEIILSFCARLIVIPLIGINFSELLFYELMLQVIVLLHHSNLSIGKSFDPIFRLVFVSPDMHKVHHSDFQPETDSNYSTVLSIWDKLFGSYKEREDLENINYGLKEYKDPKDQQLKGLLKTPFHGKNL